MADKQSQEGLTRSEVAARFGVSVSTVRAWQREFKAWLEVEKQEYGGGRRQATRYSDSDLLVFTVVHRLTKEGLRYADIRERLDKELTGVTLDDIRQEQPEIEEEGPGVSIVEYSAVVAGLQRAEGKLEAIEDERDYLRERVSELEDKLDTTQEQLMEEVKKSWWQKLRGR